MAHFSAVTREQCECVAVPELQTHTTQTQPKDSSVVYINPAI